MTEANCGTLYVCGTPIGNLKDATLRLVEVLGAVDAIACEDTRRTSKILARFGLKKPLLSLHQHVERERAARVLRLLEEGKSVAFVSDAGMPVISDPGALLIRSVRDAGHKIVLIPGPSAVSSALSLSGFPGDRFVFGGFPPKKPKERRAFFEDWVRPDVTAVFFESPFRVKKSLEDLSRVHTDAAVCLCREMTKIHEGVIEGTAEEILRKLEGGPLRGEWVVVVRVGKKETGSNGPVVEA